MRATFEEKTFENYFNTELDRRSAIFFPLGQVQEGNLGFDASAFSRNRRLWRRLGYRFEGFRPFEGVALRDIAHEMERFLGFAIENIPRMKSNLLFQYKKPEFISTRAGKEWLHWSQPYFRYTIYKEQQDLLMQIHNQFSSKTLVLYASPAIQDVNELVDKKISNQIIDSSNFRKSVDLNGHVRNTYIEAGTYSIACSEPKKIPHFDLIKELELISESGYTDDESNRDFIIKFRKSIVSIVYENPFWGSSFRKLNGLIQGVDQYELFYSFIVLSNFRHLTNTQWLVKL